MRTLCAIAGVVVAAALLVVPQAAARTGPAQAPGSAAPPAAPGTSLQAVTAEKNGFVWDNRPGIRYGDWFTVDLRALLEGDVRSTDPDLSGGGPTFEWSRRRVGVEGTATKYVEYEIDYGFDAAGEARAELRDAFVNVRPAVFARVQGGRFKIPFGYERLTGPRNLDFVYRSRVSDALTPGRSVGAMVHGRAFGRALQYGVGLFNDDGDQPPGHEPVEPLPEEPAPEEGRTWAARATVAPLRLTSLPGKYNNLEVGGAFTSGTVPQGRNHLQGETVFGGSFFDRQYYTNGPRKRFGLDVSWAIGPASIAAEYLVAREAREGQGVGNEGQADNDLPEIEGRGWYIAGTWVVTGENREGGVKVKRPLLRGGFGALEVAARYERLRFASAGSPQEPPSRSPRATTIAGNADRAWTIGVNWYVNRWVKIRFNAINERLDDPELGPAPGYPSLWTMVTQFGIGF
jgi:phosphate-selective porin OprO/OprP